MAAHKLFQISNQAAKPSIFLAIGKEKDIDIKQDLNYDDSHKETDEEMALRERINSLENHIITQQQEIMDLKNAIYESNRRMESLEKNKSRTGNTNRSRNQTRDKSKQSYSRSNSGKSQNGVTSSSGELIDRIDSKSKAWKPPGIAMAKSIT